MNMLLLMILTVCALPASLFASLNTSNLIPATWNPTPSKDDTVQANMAPAPDNLAENAITPGEQTQFAGALSIDAETRRALLLDNASLMAWSRDRDAHSRRLGPSTRAIAAGGLVVILVAFTIARARRPRKADAMNPSCANGLGPSHGRST